MKPTRHLANVMTWAALGACVAACDDTETLGLAIAGAAGVAGAQGGQPGQSGSGGGAGQAGGGGEATAGTGQSGAGQAGAGGAGQGGAGLSGSSGQGGAGQGGAGPAGSSGNSGQSGAGQAGSGLSGAGGQGGEASGAVTRGRLLIVQAPDGSGQPGVNLTVYDLDEKKEAGAFTLPEQPNTVVASWSRQFGALVPDGPGLPLRFVDGGVRVQGAEVTRAAPSVVPFSVATEDAWPFSAQGDWVSIFEFGGVARFVRTDASLSGGSPVAVTIDTGTPHFGFGAALGDVLFTTVAAEVDGDPTGVQAHDSKGQKLGAPFACEGAAGRVVLGDLIAFTCADGVLVVRGEGGQLKGKKTPYPDADRFIGDNFFAFPGLGILAGDYRYGGEQDPAPPPRLVRFDPQTEQFQFLDLPGDYWSLRPEPGAKGRKLVVLDGTFKQVSDVGHVRVVDVGSWKDEGTVDVAGLNYTGPWGWFSRLTMGPGEAYVSASLTGEVVAIDLATKGSERITVGGSPGELDLVGIPVE